MNQLREPIQGDLLVTSRRIFESLHYQKIDELKDASGHTFAFKLQSPSGLPFCLVAKGSRLMGDIVSMQKDLIQNWHGPLVLAWKQPGELAASYYVFDPDAIMIGKAFENDRFNVRMVNFSIQLGKAWKIDESNLDDVWEQLKRKRSAKLDAFCREHRRYPC